jgi:myo-inositol-1(or 4)-monophosphatase
MTKRLESVCAVAREAGAIAVRLRGSLTSKQKDDGSYVTNADVAVQEFLLEKLGPMFPGTGIVAEENDQVASGHYDSLLAIDPIDGTDSYFRGFPHFGISIGLIVGKRCVLGVFYNPVLDEMYAVDEGVAPTLNGEPFSVAVPEQKFGPLLVPSNFHRRFTTDYRGKVRCYGSMAHHLCYVACGRASATLAYETHIWDLAAGVALVEAAGGRVSMLDGTPFDPTQSLDGHKILEPSLIAPPRLWDGLAQSFKPLDL